MHGGGEKKNKEITIQNKSKRVVVIGETWTVRYILYLCVTLVYVLRRNFLRVARNVLVLVCLVVWFRQLYQQTSREILLWVRCERFGARALLARVRMNIQVRNVRVRERVHLSLVCKSKN